VRTVRAKTCSRNLPRKPGTILTLTTRAGFPKTTSGKEQSLEITLAKALKALNVNIPKYIRLRQRMPRARQRNMANLKSRKPDKRFIIEVKRDRIEVTKKNL